MIVSDVCKIRATDYLNYFDFILFMDVLEHLDDPWNVLKKMKIYLKDGGFVVISVPNIANWAVRWNLLWGNFEYGTRGILDKTHLRFFNEKSAKKLLEDAGFEIVKYDIIPSIPLVKMRAKFMYLISKLRRKFFCYSVLIGRQNKEPWCGSAE